MALMRNRGGSMVCGPIGRCKCGYILATDQSDRSARGETALSDSLQSNSHGRLTSTVYRLPPGTGAL
eukprot:1193612-Prorocentrum_minimum.AAC.1